MMSRLGTAVVAVLVAGGAAAQSNSAIADAGRNYDLESATRILAELDPEARPRLVIDAALLVAELERIEFEQTPISEGVARREIGERIDAAARRGLDLVELLAESSESWRLRADLIGTLIRSKYRGKRHKARMERASATAIELDRTNAKAYVSAAKPDVLKPGRERPDIEKGLALIQRALELDPELESALLLRGHALWELGDQAQARASWTQALSLNPACRPAEQWLESGPPENPRL